jgi:hypothetical protein
MRIVSQLEAFRPYLAFSYVQKFGELLPGFCFRQIIKRKNKTMAGMYWI